MPVFNGITMSLWQLVAMSTDPLLEFIALVMPVDQSRSYSRCCIGLHTHAIDGSLLVRIKLCETVSFCVVMPPFG